MAVKVILLTIFFVLSMTSEVKGHFYKVLDNPLEFLHTYLDWFLSSMLLKKCKGRKLNGMSKWLKKIPDMLMAFKVKDHFHRKIM